MPQKKQDASSLYCPNGHLRHVCTRHGKCRIQDVVRIEDKIRRTSGYLAGDQRIRRTEEVDRLMAAHEYAVAPDCSKTGLSLMLECTHNTYQRSRNFMITELMYCDKCENWYHIIQITHNRTGFIEQVNLRIPRMTPLSSRPNFASDIAVIPERPPIDPAVIERNNMAKHIGQKHRGVIRGRKV